MTTYHQDCYGLRSNDQSMKMKMSASKIGLRPRRKHGSTKTSGDTSKEPSPDSKCPSPDSKCPICLDAFNNMSYLDLCLHKFCFRCIHEWSKNKAECPLCKQPFNSIYHSIKSDQDFKKYDLRPTENGSFGSFGGVRFRYHTTMTGVRQRAERRTASPPDHGVLFESWGDAYQLQERSLRRMMLRLAARRRAAREGRAVRAVREQEMIAFRRALYRRGVRVQSVENGGRSRDITAEFFQRNPACLHRLVPWLKRELMVLYGAHGSLVNIVQHVVMSRITRFDLEASDILEELRPFLQARTEHFLHEFISFAKSPFNMEGYDQHAVYDCPDSLLNDGGDDDDDDDGSSRSSVIAISEDDQMSLDLDTQGESVSSGTLSQSAWDDETPGPSYSTLDERGKSLPLSIPDSDSSQEDEPTESSSSSRLKRHSSNPRTDAFRSVVKKDGSLLSSDDDDDDDDLVGDAGDEDDCIIVGFVKPLVQRTPELVQLSSDDSSEESVHVEVDRKPQLPQHIRFTTPGASPAPAAESSLSPPASDRRGRPSTSKAQSGLARSGRLGESERRRGAEGCRQRRTSRSGNRTRRSRRDRRSGSASDSSGIPATSSPSGVVTLSRSRRRRRRRHSRSSSSRERSRSKKDGKERRQNGDREAPRRSKRASSRSSTHRGRDRDSEKMVYYSRGRRGVASRSRSRSRSREPRHGGPRGDDSPSPPTGAYSSGSRSPSSRKRLSHDKPGGKRKYKTRHLEQEPDKSVDLRTSAGKQKRSKREKSAKEKRDTGGGDDNDAGNGSDRGGKQQPHHKKKKKHKKKKSKKHRSRERTGRRSPAAVITIESDSDGRSTDGNVDLSGKDGITTSATGVTPPDTDHVVDDVSNKSDPLPADGVLFTPTINDNNNKKNS